MSFALHELPRHVLGVRWWTAGVRLAQDRPLLQKRRPLTECKTQDKASPTQHEAQGEATQDRLSSLPPLRSACTCKKKGVRHRRAGQALAPAPSGSVLNSRERRDAPITEATITLLLLLRHRLIQKTSAFQRCVCGLHSDRGPMCLGKRGTQDLIGRSLMGRR